MDVHTTKVDQWPETVLKCKEQSAVDLIKEYADVFSGLGHVPGEVSLKVDPNFTPVAHPPRPIPVALREKVQEKLEEMVSDGIIERVPIGTPTLWCSAMHIVLKKDKSVRITIDPKDLNKALIREYHPTTTVEEIAQRCGSARHFTVLDANQGYYQLVLDQDSRNYTAFNTPFGRYRFLRLPMGIKSSPEIFQRVFSDLFSHIEGLESIMDDFLIAEDKVNDHNSVLRETLQTARENNVTFSLKKLQLCEDKVKYSGQRFSKEGLKIDEDRIKAIKGLPDPKSVKEIETLLGMVTYICKYMKNLSSVTEPLRSLIKESHVPGFKFQFDPIHKQACVEIRNLLSTAPVLKYYQVHDPVTISCDASQSGLGSVLFQNGGPVAFASKALTDAEYAYAQIEKEMLAIVFSVHKFHTYIYGKQDVTIETDHAPLIQIMEKPLHQVPLRLQKMRMRLQGYDFKLVHKKGTEIPVADCLSRFYIKETEPVFDVFTVDTEEVQTLEQISPKRVREIQTNTTTDPELQAVIGYVVEGWPDHRSQVESVVKPYFDARDVLSMIDGMVFKGTRVVIPKVMRPEALKILHQAHQGIVKTKQLARDLLYWPGMNAEIEDVVAKCSTCQEHRSMQTKEPLLPTPIPTRQWQHVAEDLFDCLDSKWLIIVDYFSEYFEIERMEQTTGRKIIEQNKKWFSTHGIPDQVTSDNGPPWNGHEWTAFADQYDFNHTPISPLHSQSNGMVEKSVDIAKRMLIKCHETESDMYLALLNLRNTPRDEIVGSPAQRLFSRRTRTKLPTAPEKLRPQVQKPEHVSQKLQDDRHIRAKQYFDRKSRELSPLISGDTVRVRVGKTWQPALLLPPESQIGPSRHVGPRSYKIQMPSGRKTRRNRRHLMRTREGPIYRRLVEYEMDEIGPIQQNRIVPQLVTPRQIIPDLPQVPQIPLPAQSPVLSPIPRHVPPLSPNTYSTPRQLKSPIRPPNPVPILVPAAQTVPVQKAPVVTTRSGRISRPPVRLKDYV